MKKLLTLLALVFCLTGKAQYVTIPDAKFAAYLQSIIPAAMNGDQMDTTNMAVIALTRINVKNDSIGDLTGVQYFDSLKTLNCANNIGVSAPSNYLTGLPKLPGTLDTLICFYNQITNLPSLPNTLKYIACSLNQLTSLPALPTSLKNLNCQENRLTALPALPPNIDTLQCDENSLVNLPALPNSLIYLSCQENSLTSIPTLPSSLVQLNCYYNQITSLPALPNSLRSLLCGNNQLTNLPPLPDSLLDLLCNNNSLTSLPVLPNTLYELDCTYNQISCFPIFPYTLAEDICNISNNPFSCVPNYVASMDSTTLTYPLCVQPTLLVSSNNYTICKGDSQTLSVSGANTYTWSPSATLNNSNSSSPTASPTVTTVYSVIATDSNGCGNINNPTTVTITINILSVNSATICTPGVATLTASGANTYTWNTGATGATITPSPTITTNYTVTGTDTIGCVITDTTKVIVNPMHGPATPVLSDSINNPLLICQGQSAISTFSVTPDTSSSIPVWYVGNINVYTGNSYTVIDSIAGTTVYTVIDSSAVTGCTSASTGGILTVTLTVNPIPSVPQLVDSSFFYCQTTTTYSPINVSGSGIILWSTNPTMTPIINAGNSYAPATLPLGTTTYYVADSSTVGGCINSLLDSISITITADTVPTVSYLLVPDTVPHVWDMYVSYSSNIVNARWYWGDGTDTLGLYVSHTYNSSGVYNICVTVYNACGDSSSYCLNDSIYRTTSNSMVRVNVMQSQAAGISQISGLNANVSIYPNPTNGNFTIESNCNTKQTMQVYDVNGKLVLNQAISGKTTIDASHLNEGVYNINIISNEGIVNKRLVIVR